MAAPVLCPFCERAVRGVGDGTFCGACGRSLVLLGRWRLDALIARGAGTFRYAAGDAHNEAAPSVDAWVTRQPELVDAGDALVSGQEDGGAFVIIRPAQRGAEAAAAASPRAPRGPGSLGLVLVGAAALLGIGIAIGFFIRPSQPSRTQAAAPGDPLAEAPAASVATVEPPAPVPTPVPVETAVPPPVAYAVAPTAAPDWSRGACDPIEDCYEHAKAWGAVNGTMTVHFDGKGKATSVSFTGPVPYAVQTCLRTAGMAATLDGYAGPPANRSCTFSGNIVRGTAEMMYDSDFEATKR